MGNVKKARYDGPSGTGVDLTVEVADGSVRRVHVEQGHQLPTEIDGQSVPATVRDSLTAQGDWTEVNVNTDPPKVDNPPKADDKAAAKTAGKE